ncbi:MAG: B12-binding domain-containing radical SAM protein [Planctomycetes bacterium]|nr:B12-binding domain-containing radical SAM protein [Planctomycetota bacterium]
MRVLLAAPAAPVTWWGFEFSMPFVGRRTAFPPLGLITVAALLPAGWEIRFVDTACRRMTRADVEWADVVMTGGMRLQLDSMREIVATARAAGRITVAGGAAVTAVPDEIDADVVFRGELEGRVGELVDALDSAVRDGGRRVLDPAVARPELGDSPTPRFDLLRLPDYASASVQFSRGCPFRCEFCDVVELFGRRPRVKRPEQLVAELESLYLLGHRGSVFVVDDNFIGHRRAVLGLLRAVADWQHRRGFPFTFCTEASIDLARDPDLVRAMRGAGFDSVFVGIESAEPAALAGARKVQNLGQPPREAVRALHRGGLEVMGGFIVGFDEERPGTCERQRRLIEDAGIPIAMIGVLTALPGTALEKRLRGEGRLRHRSTGDQFGRPNFAPRMDEADLLRGYAELLAAVYDPRSYYARCEAFVRAAPPPVRAFPARDRWRAAWNAIVRIGLRGPRRRPFWRLLLTTLLRAPRRLAWSFARAIEGEHLIRYTAEVVLPRIRAEVARIERERQAGAPRPTQLVM